MDKQILFGLIVLSAIVFAGCNTMAGFGKDVSKLGEKVEDGVAGVGRGLDKLGDKIESKAAEKKGD